ncbi:uncharacterized protein L3040_002384 [Drepanopeziza brunnea f. sp. 'multigermtubi']|uniref:Uncharacterized protein n=1 Tax=Marssonina brunnea f. sp. multigermtubi (strain MB_m1) TaxID=1072389 RepID=K1WQL4_MARBU|nr:uncharacterized protein MBM_01887 [Drepanopeziza brunnea f. sp. 'multigermtubi' MB_m1]EKD19935.1 hypothetical protein MBM_01887 [Drepanopeziza brunnea f. sp. 'multigermtubi' MB_m1]KAJ5050506.1 hypothetical protein L3040_002384 [Drepanopeziza brunnea f. sp. 'multigermtubi']
MASKAVDENIAELVNAVEPEANTSVDIPIEAASDPISIPPEALADSKNPAMAQEQLSDAISHILLASLEAATKKLVNRNEVSAEKEAGHADTNEFQVPREPFLSSPATFKVPHSRNLDFVGRIPALSQLFGMWNPGQTSQARIAIVGLGGVGKTELAIEFVHRVRHVSPTTPVFWFGPDDLGVTDGKSDAAPGMQLEEWIRLDWGSETMLVVDTADRFELLQDDLPNGRLMDALQQFKGTIILLTRSIQNAGELTGSHGLCEVGELDADASLVLFRNHLSPEASSATEIQIQEIVGVMAYLPRALVQVAEVVNRTGMTVSQFLDLYKRADQFKLRLLGTLDPVSAPDHGLSVFGRGVFDVRKYRKRYPKFSRFLYQLYYLGGVSVPWKVFSADDPIDMVIILVLVRGNFIIVEDVSQQTYTIHPLVCLAIRNYLASIDGGRSEDDIAEERNWYDEIILSFSKVYPDATQDTRAWWKQCFAHLIRGYKLHNNALKIAVATIYHRESTFFKRKGMYFEALKMTELARSALPEPIPPEQLAIIQENVSLLHSLAKYREMHEVLQKTSPDSDPGKLWKKRMQAKLEMADCANQYDSAIEMFRQVLLTVQASDESETSVSVSMDDLGVVLMHKGRYRDAIAQCQKALTERKESLGSSYPDTLSSCHNLAEALKRNGKYDEALRYIQGAVAGRETILGADHPETVHSRAVKASILRCKAISISDFEEAESLLLECIDRLGTVLSKSHPIVTSCRSELALIFLGRGNYDVAEQINQTVLTTREHGPWLEASTHPDTLSSQHQLVEVLRLKEGCKAADLLSERVLNDRTAFLTSGTLSGNDFHPDQLAALHDRAIILSGLKQHPTALEKIDLALAGRKTLLGDEHPDTLMSLTWKGEIMRAQLPRYQSERGQILDSIESMHRQAHEGLSWIFGPEHQKTLQCLTNLALLKNERGGPFARESEDLYRQICKSYQRTLGDLHPETLKSKGRYAEAMRASSLGNHSPAKQLWRESCSGFAKMYGPDAWVTAQAYKEYEKFLRTYPDS